MVSQLVAVRRIKESDCDALIQKYTCFLDNIRTFGSEKFSNFNLSTDRLDELFSTHMNTEPYRRFFKAVQLLLVLSHGQASVERGFSVNKELEVENPSNQSLVAQRLVCDHIKAVDGILEVTPVLQQENDMKDILINKEKTKKSEEESRKRKSLLDRENYKEADC